MGWGWGLGFTSWSQKHQRVSENILNLPQTVGLIQFDRLFRTFGGLSGCTSKICKFSWLHSLEGAPQHCPML